MTNPPRVPTEPASDEKQLECVPSGHVWPRGVVDGRRCQCGATVFRESPPSAVTGERDADLPIEQDEDFKTVMRAISLIVTINDPGRTHTFVPISDLKAFARLVTRQCEQIAKLDAECARLREERDTMTKENDAMLRDLGKIYAAVESDEATRDPFGTLDMIVRMARSAPADRGTEQGR